MKRHIAAVCLGCLIAGAACAAPQPATAAPAAAAPAAAPSPAPVAEPAAAPAEPVRRASRSRSGRDARGCLRFEDNRKVMACAEPYR